MYTRFIILILLIFQWTLTYSQKNQADTLHVIDSLLGQLNNGNDDYTIVTEIYRYNKNLTEDSLNALFNITNDNYFRNTKSNNKELDLKFRQISFSDQLFRIRCYFHNSIKYKVVQRNDSLLQLQFLSITNSHKELSLIDGSFYQQTFLLLLMHSLATPQTHFFEDNFHMYSAGLFNNFKKFNDLQCLLDMYLKFRFNKQFFNTEAGKGLLPDHSFGLLPKISDADFKKVLSDLNVNNAIY